MAALRLVIQYDLNRDVQAAQVMASRFDPFVYENVTYGSMPADLPKLTIGRLRMRLDRLSLPGNLLSDESGCACQARKLSHSNHSGGIYAAW